MERAIGHISQIPKGEGRNFALGTQRFAVFHTHAGRLFATQAECPHRGGPLADGLTDEASVVCPLHDRVFDFRTGAGLGNESCIRVYPVREAADGSILLVTEPVTGEGVAGGVG
jgi:nitrite reductase (NADH) small subunit